MSLSRDELWSLYTLKNPDWLTQGISLSPVGSRLLFEDIFDRAHDRGVENGRALAEMERRDRGRTAGSDVAALTADSHRQISLFERVFGRKSQW